MDAIELFILPNSTSVVCCVRSKVVRIVSWMLVQLVRDIRLDVFDIPLKKGSLLMGFRQFLFYLHQVLFNLYLKRGSDSDPYV